jgi:hypothetical protein
LNFVFHNAIYTRNRKSPHFTSGYRSGGFGFGRQSRAGLRGTITVSIWLIGMK